MLITDFVMKLVSGNMQLWVFEEPAIEYGWTKETSPIEVINPNDKIWEDEEYYWVRD